MSYVFRLQSAPELFRCTSVLFRGRRKKTSDGPQSVSFILQSSSLSLTDMLDMTCHGCSMVSLPQVRDDIYASILAPNLPNLLEHGNITALTQLWSSGQISNFEYLTHLNKHAGRSFNDLMQYPVFPFILRDYTSEMLDLQDSNIYRSGSDWKKLACHTVHVRKSFLFTANLWQH